MKSRALPAPINPQQAQETKAQETVPLAMLVITVLWDQLNNIYVLQVITALLVVAYQHNVEQDLTTHQSEQLIQVHV